MWRGLLVLALLTSCIECDEKAFPIVDGRYSERGDDTALIDAEIRIENDEVTIDYTGDDGERYRVSYEVVERYGG